MTHVEELFNRLGEMGVTKFSVFPGTDPNVSAEQKAKAILDVLNKIEDGDYTPVV